MHAGPVTCLCLSDDQLILSGSSLGSITVSGLLSDQRVAELRSSHSTGYILCMLYEASNYGYLIYEVMRYLLLYSFLIYPQQPWWFCLLSRSEFLFSYWLLKYLCQSLPFYNKAYLYRLSPNYKIFNIPFRKTHSMLIGRGVPKTVCKPTRWNAVN